MIRRRCDLFRDYHGPHTWERLNPLNRAVFRRGRVTFLCLGAPLIPHAEEGR